MVLFSSLLTFLFFTAPALADVKRYDLNIVNSLVSPDGGAARVAILADGRVPGPLITAKRGDLLQVKVANELTDTSMTQGTSIHWHGFFQYRNAESDGTAWVTQCPISPGHDFTYNMTITQTGTYWYHSHISTQYCDGLRGPLIVYDDDDPLKALYDVDNASTIITLEDWFHSPSPLAFQNFGVPEATLINGLGRLPGNSQSPLAVVNVAHNQRYRLRVLNIACMSGFNFSIDGHTMRIIETDGEETLASSPSNVFEIFPGQRLSLLFKANQPIGNYWIRSVPSFAVLGPPVEPSTQTGVNMAILRYKGATIAEPTTNQTGTDIALEEKLIPLNPLRGISGQPDISTTLSIGVNFSGPWYTVNGYTYHPPPVPVLLQILNGTDPFKLMPQGSVIPLPRNKLIEVTVPGGSLLAPHPFHLHGHNFGVVRSAGTTTTNTINPPIRDVVSTGALASDNVTIRFRTDNPGPWIFHCHIDFHLEAGLAVIFAEDTQGQLSGGQSQIITPAWKDLCPTWNSLTSGKQYSLNDTS